MKSEFVTSAREENTVHEAYAVLPGLMVLACPRMLKVPLVCIMQNVLPECSPTAAARSSEPYSNLNTNQQHFCNRFFILQHFFYMSLYRD